MSDRSNLDGTESLIAALPATREEHGRNALRRLNLTFRESAISWPSLASIIEDRDELKEKLRSAFAYRESQEGLPPVTLTEKIA
jgi:hypothetical protein